MAAVCIGSAAVTSPGTAVAAPVVAPVALAAQPVLTAEVRALADRYDELRPLVNHSAALLHWAMQFAPVPGNVRFHAWTFYQHVVDPTIYSAVHNVVPVVGGTAPVDQAFVTLTGDVLSAFQEFVAAELAGHSNVVPPDPDGAGAQNWAHWAIEVGVAPLYYLPAPPALIVQVPIAARFAVDVAGAVATNIDAVLSGAATPEQAVNALGEFVRYEAIPQLARAEQAVFTPPAPPASLSTPAADAPAPALEPRSAVAASPAQTGRIMLRDILDDRSAKSVATHLKTSAVRTALRTDKPGEANDSARERIDATRAVQRLNRHSTPVRDVRTVHAPKKETAGSERPTRGD